MNNTTSHSASASNPPLPGEYMAGLHQTFLHAWEPPRLDSCWQQQQRYSSVDTAVQCSVETSAGKSRQLFQLLGGNRNSYFDSPAPWSDDLIMTKEVFPVDPGYEDTTTSLGGAMTPDQISAHASSTAEVLTTACATNEGAARSHSENIILLNKLRLCTSSVLRSALEGWLAGLDADTKAHVLQIWK
jgi:hypothetical protein